MCKRAGEKGVGLSKTALRKPFRANVDTGNNPAKCCPLPLINRYEQTRNANIQIIGSFFFLEIN